MTHVDLFSGIGGFALAASWAWPDHEPVLFCEKDEYCQRVLARHWPGVPIVDDIRQITATHELRQIDLLTGGFPCQPFSHAGQRNGIEDDRYFWPEMARCIEIFKPRWVVAENVAGIYSMEDVFEQVCSDLEGLGYEVQALRIPAGAVGAQHRRDRWWFVAHSNRAGSQGRNGSVVRERARERPTWAGGTWSQPWPVTTYAEGVYAQGWENGQGQKQSREGGAKRQAGPSEREFRGTLDGVLGWVDVSDRTNRLRALGNAIVPQVAYEIFLAIKQHGDV